MRQDRRVQYCRYNISIDQIQCALLPLIELKPESLAGGTFSKGGKQTDVRKQKRSRIMLRVPHINEDYSTTTEYSTAIQYCTRYCRQYSTYYIAIAKVVRLDPCLK